MRILLAIQGVVAVVVAASAIGVAQAGSPNDYARRWPLETTGDSAAWQFEPDAAVLAALQDPNFGDLQVFDATGKPVPTGRMADHGAGAAGRWLPARFASSGPAEGAAGDAGVMSYTYRLPAALPARAVRLDRDALRTTVAVLYRKDGAWRLAARIAPPPALAAPDMVPAPASTPPPADAITFAAPIVAEAWRVNSGVALSPAPRLELEVRPARFAFVAEGMAPYVLAVGHPVLRRQQRPLDPKLARWIAGDPPLARLGPPTQAPFVPAAAPVDAGPAWVRWWPWLAGVAALLGAALLLRRRRPPAGKG
jgi:hypothetical protein